MILPPGINLLNYGWKEMPGVIIFCNLKVEEYIILISFIISSSTLGSPIPNLLSRGYDVKKFLKGRDFFNIHIYILGILSFIVLFSKG